MVSIFAPKKILHIVCSKIFVIILSPPLLVGEVGVSRECCGRRQHTQYILHNGDDDCDDDYVDDFDDGSDYHHDQKYDL